MWFRPREDFCYKKYQGGNAALFEFKGILLGKLCLILGCLYVICKA